MPRTGALKTVTHFNLSESGQKIRDVRYLVSADRFVVIFENGKEYSLRRSVLDVDDGSEVLSVQVDRRRFFFRVKQGSGNCYEIPWDRVLHESEPSYPYFRARVDQSKNAQQIGNKIRELREAKHITQEDLAKAVGMMRSNISRIEAAKHRPTLATMEKIAMALKVPVADLLAVHLGI